MYTKKDIETYVIDLRRYFHKNPEASLREYNTSKKIKEELEKLGIKYKEVGETGVIGFIGKNRGSDIVLRADIDALEIEDKKDVSYKSKSKGLMHACGHDGHTASLLGACKILKNIEDKLSKRVVVIFQQAEEIGQGARQFSKEGYLDNISSAFAIHYASDVPAGKIAVRPGPVMAACDYFKARIIGKSGHVSKPHKSIDALYIASSIVVNIQSIVSRNTNPLDPVLIGIGKLNSGTRYNIIANEAILEGTFRTFHNATRIQVKREIENIFKYTAKSNNAEVEIEFSSFADPVINDKEEVKKINAIAKSLLGEDSVIDDREKSLGADDFAEFGKYAPSIYVHVGSGNSLKPNTTVEHHNELFDLDEEVLIIGTMLYVNYALYENGIKDLTI